MQLAFLALRPAERTLYLEQAAARRGLHVAIVEKDFWVCWLLATLFDDAKLGGAIVFKGGTSLSKVYGAINRFSEDIDLSISPAYLGIGEDVLDATASRRKHDLWMASLQVKCAEMVQSAILPSLERMTTDVLGHRQSGQTWFEYVTDPATGSPVLLFHYPTQQLSAFTYLPRSVKLEFGSLTDQRPTGHHAVRPWIADMFPWAFGDWHCQVVALDVDRMFWEKATILHAEFHRDAATPMPPRYSRHYADVAALAHLAAGQRALSNANLCDQVVTWKTRFFPRGWARYDLARPGTFRFAPPAVRIKELAADYAAMRPMYFSEPPPFSAVVSTLEQMESTVNRRQA